METRSFGARTEDFPVEHRGAIEFFVILPRDQRARIPSRLVREESYDLDERGASALAVCEIAYSAHGSVTAGRSPFPLEKLISARTLRVAYID